jgi:hypothetical protein
MVHHYIGQVVAVVVDTMVLPVVLVVLVAAAVVVTALAQVAQDQVGQVVVLH